MDDNTVHLIFSLWCAALTIIGVLFMWMWNRLVKQVDDKAEKTEVTQLRDDLRERWITQDKMHAENRTRLDRIFDRVVKQRYDQS